VIGVEWFMFGLEKESELKMYGSSRYSGMNESIKKFHQVALISKVWHMPSNY
jgi:hypothetical protein